MADSKDPVKSRALLASCHVSDGRHLIVFSGNIEEKGARRLLKKIESYGTTGVRYIAKIGGI